MDNTKIVCLIVEEKLQNKLNVNEENNFIDLGLDSMDVVDIVVKVEQQLNVTFDDEQIAQFSCVNDIVEAIIH